MIHAASSGSPPHLFTKNAHGAHAPCWISHDEMYARCYVCRCVYVCGGVFPTAPAYLWIIISLWNVTFQTQWPLGWSECRVWLWLGGIWGVLSQWKEHWRGRKPDSDTLEIYKWVRPLKNMCGNKVIATLQPLLEPLFPHSCIWEGHCCHGNIF